MIRLALTVLTLAACAGSSPAPSRPRAAELAAAFAAAMSAHDAHAAAALFAPDASVALVEGSELHGCVATEAALADLLVRFSVVRVAIGRQWLARDASVIELVLTAMRANRPVGVAAAAVVALDRSGQITSARLFVDIPTLVGQIDPAKLPEGARTRAAISGPPAGTAITTSTGSPTEAANLASADASWARLDAHDPAGVLAAAAPGYVYDDFAGPAPLDEAGTRALLERWLGMVPDFRIAAEPTHFAAGDDVITESVEQMTFRGNAITLRGLDIKHLERGRVTREWQYANGAGALAALLGIKLVLP